MHSRPLRPAGSFAALLFVAATLLAGCNPCVERCRAESRRYDPCLDDWNLGWADLGAQDARDYRLTCVDNESVFMDSLDEESRATETAACSTLLTRLQSSDGDCDAVWEALVDYGE